MTAKSRVKTANYNVPDVNQFILKKSHVLGLEHVTVKQIIPQETSSKLYDLLIIDEERDRVLLGCYLNKTLERNDYDDLREDWLYMRENYEGKELSPASAWKNPFTKGVCIIADGFSKQFLSMIHKSDITMPCVLLKYGENGSNQDASIVKVMDTWD